MSLRLETNVGNQVNGKGKKTRKKESVGHGQWEQEHNRTQTGKRGTIPIVSIEKEMTRQYDKIYFSYLF